MKVLGITAEYNPFHNGHAYHIKRAKELTGADVMIATMSGDFTQRGEPAIADKWSRSRDAVSNGIDLVFELPFIFACNRAPFFAAGGVDSLVMAGATHIAFGCEADDSGYLEELAARLGEKDAELQEMTRSEMTGGSSYAKAYGKSVRSVLGDDAADIILEPNNILAVEYIRRINGWKEKGIDVAAVPVKRYGSGYRDMNSEKGFAGASEIRKIIEDGRGFDLLPKLVPEKSALGALDEKGFTGISDAVNRAIDREFQLIKGILVRSSAEEIAGMYCIGEGIENRLKSRISKAEGLDEFISSAVSRRYTASAIRRMLVYIALGLKGVDADKILDSSDGASCCGYLRVLAANSTGRRQLKNSGVMTITNVNRQRPEEGRFADMLDLDIKAADLYNTLFDRRLYDYSDRVTTPYIES